MKYLICYIFILIAVNNVTGQYMVDSMIYSKNYFPGTYDINGRYLGSTETMSIVVHKGKLFAGMGNWMDYPITPQSEGTQVLRKDTYNSPWVVDTSLGPESLRSEAILSVIFTKDYQGNTLNPPVNIIVGGFGDINPPRIVNIWVRNDITGKWIANNAYVLPTGSAGIRCFKIHTDKVTLKQWLFCGVAEGNIIKAGYNPNSQGYLFIDTAKELRNLGRVMAMTVCNGDLYAAAGLDIIGNDTVGGLYRRIDGVNPTWQLVYRWPYIPGQGDEQKIMRGITTIPDPLNSNNQVIIGTRSHPGVIEIIQPFNNHNVYTELNVKSFLGTVWGVNYTGPSLMAYNYFEPDTLNNQKVWWVSLGAIHPNGNVHPYNGSYYLLRYQNGTYKYGHIYDNNNPVPNGISLRATRTICKSPFSQDSNRIYYFGGYDCANDTSDNTSWIYKGRFVNTLSNIIILSNTNPGKYSLGQNYPNPFNPITNVKFEIPNTGRVNITVYDVLGKEVAVLVNEPLQPGIYQVQFDAGNLPSGVYFYRLESFDYLYTKKLILMK